MLGLKLNHVSKRGPWWSICRERSNIKSSNESTQHNGSNSKCLFNAFLCGWFWRGEGQKAPDTYFIRPALVYDAYQWLCEKNMVYEQCCVNGNDPFSVLIGISANSQSSDTELDVNDVDGMVDSLEECAMIPVDCVLYVWATSWCQKWNLCTKIKMWTCVSVRLGRWGRNGFPMVVSRWNKWL